MSATVFTYFNMKARGDAIKYPFISPLLPF